MGESLEDKKRHGESPEEHVEGAPRCPPEAQVEILLVLGPLLDATDPGVDKGSRGIERGAQLLRGGWGGHALLRGEDRSRAVQVSCFANRRSVHVVSLVAPVDSHPQQARGSECHVGAARARALR